MLKWRWFQRKGSVRFILWGPWIPPQMAESCQYIWFLTKVVDRHTDLASLSSVNLKSFLSLVVYCFGIFALMMLSLLETILAMFLMEKDSVAQDDRADEDKSLMDDSNKRDTVNRGEFNKNIRFSRDARAISAFSCTCWNKSWDISLSTRVHGSESERVNARWYFVIRSRWRLYHKLRKSITSHVECTQAPESWENNSTASYLSYNLEYVPLHFVLIISFRCEEMGCVHLWRVCWRNTS